MRRNLQKVGRAVMTTAIVSTLLCGLGCATAGKRFPAERRNEIVRGQTTMTEVREIFGKPRDVTEGACGVDWTYKYAEAVSYYFGTTAKGEALTVKFDKDGVVRDYAYSTVKR